MIAGLVLRRIEGPEKDSHSAIERKIAATTASHGWTQPLLSKYVSYQYPAGSKLSHYAEHHSWPGYLDRGIGKKCFDAMIRIANDKYGANVNSINVNEPIDQSCVNIYFFDLDTCPQFGMCKGQCCYLGFKNVVLCDARYLFQFQDVPFAEHELDSYLQPGQHFSELLAKPQPNRVNFLLAGLASAHQVLLWALAHEIGHLVHRHRPVSGAMSLVAPSQSQAKGTEMEREADEFVLEVLQSFDEGIVVVGGLGNVCDVEEHREAQKPLAHPEGNCRFAWKTCMTEFPYTEVMAVTHRC